MSRPIDFTFAGRAGVEHLPFVERHLAAAAGLVPGAPAAVSVALVGDAEMSRLHGRFIGDSSPTDVLTFELERDAAGRVTEGEVVVCVPVAERRAAADGTTADRELLLYALHGLLHLAGHDDTTADGYEAMHREEDRLLTRLGVGPVFSPPSPSPKDSPR